MLIRKPVQPAPLSDEKRLEILLNAFEENLRREIFFIRRKEAENLLELLPAQGDLIVAISQIVERIVLPEPRATALRKRLAAADAMREANRAEADRITEEMRRELDEMNIARQRIRQARQLSKTIYKEETGSRLSGFA
jgi:hypothetical protein